MSVAVVRAQGALEMKDEDGLGIDSSTVELDIAAHTTPGTVS